MSHSSNSMTRSKKEHGRLNKQMNTTCALEQSAIHQFQFMDRDEFDKSWFISSTIMICHHNALYMHVDTAFKL